MDPGPEQWEQIKSLFDAARRQPLGERERFLVERCPDEEIRIEVLSLLRNDESAPDFLRSTCNGFSHASSSHFDQDKTGTV